jgi:kynureninase
LIAGSIARQEINHSIGRINRHLHHWKAEYAVLSSAHNLGIYLFTLRHQPAAITIVMNAKTGPDTKPDVDITLPVAVGA